MRTTVTFDQDVTAAIERLRREEHRGVSEVVNDLVRRGLTRRPARPRFEQTSTPMGAPRVPMDDIGGALAVLEGDDAP